MDYVCKETLVLGRGKKVYLLHKVLYDKIVCGDLKACLVWFHVLVLSLDDLAKSLNLEPAVGKSVVTNLATSVLVD